VEESTFGGTKAASSLPCMDTSGCEECFPWSEVPILTALLFGWSTLLKIVPSFWKGQLCVVS
jgi:hypothetical protein